MIKNLIKKRISILLYFLMPILFALIINIGIIFNLQNPFPKLDELVNHFSYLRSNAWNVNLLIGAITAFVIFFALVPLSYSANYIPKGIIRKYIFEDIHTYIYFSIELSLCSVIAFFTHFETIHTINVILCITYTILAVICSVFYFYWLTKTLIPGDIYTQILNKLDLKKSKDIENQLIDKRNIFIKELNKFKNIKTEDDDPFELISRNPYRIYTSLRGLIIFIDLPKISNLLSDIEENILSITIHANIGDSIPRQQNYTDSLLMTINLVAYDKNSVKNEEIKEKLERLSIDLQKCFIIDIKQNVFLDYYYEILNDLFLCYQNLLNSNEIQLEILLDKIQTFIGKEYFKSVEEKWNTEISIKQDIFLYLMEKLTDKDNFKQIEVPLAELLLFIYYLKQLAIENKNRQLMNSILKSMFSLFFKTVISQKIYNPQLASYLLNIKEISVSYKLQQNFEKETISSFAKAIQSFYDPIINQGIQTAIECYSCLIEFHYTNHPSESYKYLTINAQYLVDFLSPLYHWKHELKSDKWVITKAKSLGKNILYLSILLYRHIEDDDLPSKLFKDVAFPLANNCHNILKYYGITNIDFLDELFYDHQFNYPFDYPVSKWFEYFSIHEAGGYSPSFYNFSNFWIVLSLFRKYFQKSFLPTKLGSNKKNGNKRSIDVLIDQLKKTDKTNIERITGIEYKTVENLCNEYEDHLDKLRNDQP